MKQLVRTTGQSSSQDTEALEWFARARALAEQVRTFRPLLHVAVNESHILEGLGEHERDPVVQHDLDARGVTAVLDRVRPG